MSENIQAISQGNYILQGTVATSAGIVGDGSTQNPLRADETVLWDGSALLTTGAISVELNEPLTNFDRIKIYGENWIDWAPMLWGEVSAVSKQFTLSPSYMGGDGAAIRMCQSVWEPSGAGFKIDKVRLFSIQGSTASTATPVNTWLRKIVGINRKAQ